MAEYSNKKDGQKKSQVMSKAKESAKSWAKFGQSG